MQDHGRIRADLEALGAIENRFAATDAERRMLEAVRSRLPAGVLSREEGLVAHPRPLLVLGMHGVFALLGGGVGLYQPQLGALVCLLTTVSLIGEGTGRAGLLRWWLAKSASQNLVIPPQQTPDTPLGTLVLATPLDVPRWRRWRPVAYRRPVMAVLASSVLVTVLLVLRSLSEPWGRPLVAVYVAALLVLGLTSLLVFFARREPPRVASEAGGPAALIELQRRMQADPVENLEVWSVFTGCGHAHQEGMKAFLRLRGERLPQPVLVLALHDAGRPPLRAVVTEGPLWRQHHRPTGPALVERLRWAGLRIPATDRPEPTDARAARNLGYRAMAFAGGEGEPSAAAVVRAADVVGQVIRWFAGDLSRVSRHGHALPVDLRRDEVVHAEVGVPEEGDAPGESGWIHPSAGDGDDDPPSA